MSQFQMLQEVEALKKTAAALKGAAAALKGAATAVKNAIKPDVQTQQAKLASKYGDIDTPDPLADTGEDPGVEAAKTIASEIMTTTKNSRRIVMQLPYRTLKSLYLQPHGGFKILSPQESSKEELKAFFESPEHNDSKFKFIKTPQAQTLHSIVNFKQVTAGDIAVIIDIPVQLFSDLAAAGEKFLKSDDDAAVRKLFAVIMNHKYYTLALNIPKTLKLKNVHAQLPVEELIDVINPHVIENYPVKQTRVAAINRWDALQVARNQDKAEADKKQADAAAREQAKKDAFDSVSDAEKKLSSSAKGKKAGVHGMADSISTTGTHQSRDTEDMAKSGNTALHAAAEDIPAAATSEPSSNSSLHAAAAKVSQPSKPVGNVRKAPEDYEDEFNAFWKQFKASGVTPTGAMKAAMNSALQSIKAPPKKKK